MAWPSLKDCRTWNEAECRAVHGAYGHMQNWISQYMSTGQIPSYASTGMAQSSWDYMRKWGSLYYKGFAQEVLRLEAARETVKVQAAAAAAAEALDPEEAAAILREMVPRPRTDPLVAPDPGAPKERAAIPWGLVMAGGAGLLLVSRLMRRRRPTPAS